MSAHILRFFTAFHLLAYFTFQHAQEWYFLGTVIFIQLYRKHSIGYCLPCEYDKTLSNLKIVFVFNHLIFAS